MSRYQACTIPLSKKMRFVQLVPSQKIAKAPGSRCTKAFHVDETQQPKQFVIRSKVNSKYQENIG